MGTVRTVIKNVLSLSFAQVALRLVSFVVIVYLARILGASNFGKISFAQAVIAYFALIGNLGLTTLGVREVARDRDKLDGYAGSILSLRLILALFSFFLLLVFSSLIRQPSQVKHLLILYGLTLFSTAVLIEWVFQALEKMEFIALSRILGRVFYAGFIFLLVKSSQQLLMIPYLWLAGSLIPAGLLIYIFVKRFGKLKLRFNFSFWKILVKQALPLATAAIMIQIYYNFDIVMLGFMKRDEVVGWYSAAYRIILFVWTFIPIFMNAIFPVMSRYYKESREKLQILISLATRFLIGLALPIGVGGTILAGPIMNFFYGEKFSNGIIGFQILIWTVVIMCFRSPYEHSFLACNKEKRYLWGVTLGAASNIILNLILIPHFGLRGAAAATIVSELVFSIYLFSYFRIVSRIEMVKYLFKPLLAAILMGLILFYFRNMNLFLLIFVGIGSYSIFIYLLKAVTSQELLQLKEQMVIKGPAVTGENQIE